MQNARSTLKKIFAENVCSKAGDEAPLLAWPVVCGAAVADKLQQMYQQYLAGLNQVSRQRVQNISFVVAPHATRPTV